MNKIRTLLALMLLVLVPTTSYAKQISFVGKWEVVEEGTTIINSSEQNDFLKKFDEKIEELNDSVTDTTVHTEFDYQTEIVNRKPIITESVENVCVPTKFETYEDALKHFESLDNENLSNNKITAIYESEPVIINCRNGACNEDEISNYKCEVSKENEEKIITEKFDYEADEYPTTEIEGYYITNVGSITVVDGESVSIDETFGNYEDASEALKEFNSNYRNVTSNIIDNIIEVRNEKNDITNIYTLDQKFNDIKDAEDKKAELEIDNKDKKVIVIINESDVDSGNDDVENIEKVFDSEEEALNYLNKLKEEGYTITNESITENTKEVIVTLNETYEEEEEAKKALSDFITNNNNAKGEVEKVIDEDENVVIKEEGTIEYSKEEDAKNAIADLKKESYDSYKIEGSIREGTKNITTSETITSDTFDTEEEALNYINNLKNQGWDVSNLKVELSTFEESIWGTDTSVEVDPGNIDNRSFTYNHFDITLLTSFTKIDTEGNSSKVEGSIAITGVKIAGKDIAMRGPIKDENRNDLEYQSINRNNLKVTNKSLVEITGTVTYKENGQDKILDFTLKGYLSESQNVCDGRGKAKGFDLKFESVIIKDNKVLIDTNLLTKYKVTGTILKTTQKDVWYVDTTKTVYGYDYKVTASGAKTESDGTYTLTATKSKDIMNKEYTLTITEVLKDYDYKVNANGFTKVYTRDVTYETGKELSCIIPEYVLTYDETIYTITDEEELTIDWVIGKQVTGIGSTTPDENEEIKPPYTGVNTHNHELSLLISLLVLALIIKFKKVLS